jgi:hypothetical protein
MAGLGINGDQSNGVEQLAGAGTGARTAGRRAIRRTFTSGSVETAIEGWTVASAAHHRPHAPAHWRLGIAAIISAAGIETVHVEAPHHEHLPLAGEEAGASAPGHSAAATHKPAAAHRPAHCHRSAAAPSAPAIDKGLGKTPRSRLAQLLGNLVLQLTDLLAQGANLPLQLGDFSLRSQAAIESAGGAKPSAARPAKRSAESAAQRPVGRRTHRRSRARGGAIIIRRRGGGKSTASKQGHRH